MIRGISDRAVFDRLWSDGKQVRSRDFRVRFLADDRTPPRVAYAISRKVGNAVVRNKLRRRLRAAVGDHVDRSGALFSDAVIVAFPSARDLTYAQVQDQVTEIMKKIEKSGVSTA